MNVPSYLCAKGLQSDMVERLESDEGKVGQNTLTATRCA